MLIRDSYICQNDFEKCVQYIFMSLQVTYLEAELRSVQRKLANKDAEISRQERELHKLKVLL